MLQIVGTTSEPPQQIDVAAPVFDDFWTLWPQERRVCKKDARSAWNRMSESQHVAALIALTVWRQIWGNRGEWEYVVHPHRWLTHERWEDELPPGYTLFPRANGKSVASIPEPQGERPPIPDHVKAMLAKLRESRK